METALPDALEITLAPERLDEGSPEERAAFGLFTVKTPRLCLTQGVDWYVNALRDGPLVSGYHAAEWFAWNWWRLRWQPRSASPHWDFAHAMSSIGEGYAWPDLTISSDGVRTLLIAKASKRPDARPFRYLGAIPVFVPSTTFEAALDRFITLIIGRLRQQGVAETNLDRLWRDVIVERGDPPLARRRRLEALLGFDVDGADDALVDAMLADAEVLGESAIDEVAADRAQVGDRDGAWVGAADFRQAAWRGFQARPMDGVDVSMLRGLPLNPNTTAWKFGAEAARMLREQERLGDGPVHSVRLAALAGASVESLQATRSARPAMSFELAEGANSTRIVLRSGWETGRRFDLCRLIFDRARAEWGDLHPATRASTYRQQAQRSFAAEFLAPFEALDAMLEGDYSAERQEEVADYFSVSPMMIETQLKNHGRVTRGDIFDDGIAA
jgi:hypothetical protein